MPRPYRKRRAHIPNAVRNTLISIGVMLVLCVAGGAAYTWYVDGRTVVKPQVAAAGSDDIPAFAKPVAPAANARVGASVETLTTPVAPGDNASITVRTIASATCKISVVYNNIASKDSGLMEKAADEYGTISWSWTVDKTAPLGTWPVNVTCYRNGKSGYVRGDLQVVKANS